MSIVELARPEIQALRPYEAAEQVDGTIRLNANESPEVCAAGKFRRPLNRYPEVRPKRLQKGLAERFGCAPGELLVTRGSSEAIDLVIRTFCRAGVDNIVTHAPSFSMYRHYAALQGASVTEVQTKAEQDFRIDVDALLAECGPETRLLFVCSPNNPTGTLLPVADLEKLLEGRSESSAVVVDEAYVEFADTPSVTALLDRYPNLLVLRTLSKALGFAGARCGAVIGQAAVISMLNAVQAPYALATPVVECVEDALRDNIEAAESVKQIVAERKRLAQQLSGFGFVNKIWPSAANFLLAEFEDAAAIMQHCERRKILLRHIGGELADCIRISVGSASENDRLLQALETFSETHCG